MSKNKHEYNATETELDYKNIRYLILRARWPCSILFSHRVGQLTYIIFYVTLFQQHFEQETDNTHPCLYFKQAVAIYNVLRPHEGYPSPRDFFNHFLRTIEFADLRNNGVLTNSANRSHNSF